MEQMVEDLIQLLVSAWNRHDPQAFGQLFTPDADYVTASGEWRNGRGAIQELLSSAGTTPAVEVVGDVVVRRYGEVGSAIFRWASLADAGYGRRGVISCVLVRHGDSWLIDLLQNTAVT